MAESLSPLLNIENLKTYYPIKRGIFSKTVGYVKAVDGVSLTINKGETLGLVGESGCGKSSLGKTIMQLEKATEGSIYFDGKDLNKLNKSELLDVRTELQMIFQDPYSSLNPRKRIKDILEEPMRVHRKLAIKNYNKEVDRLLDIIGIPRTYKNRYPHEFSGGQRQRIGIARALTLNPQLIVCDEPVSALDVSIQSQILNLLKDLQKEYKLTYLFIAHGLDAVRYISDRIAIMYLGKIVEVGNKDEIFSSPKHPYTKSLLSSYPVPDPEKRHKERIILKGDVPSPANPPSGCRFHTRCPIAKDICKSEEPKLIGENQKVACWFSK